MTKIFDKKFMYMEYAVHVIGEKKNDGTEVWTGIVNGHKLRNFKVTDTNQHRLYKKAGDAIKKVEHKKQKDKTLFMFEKAKRKLERLHSKIKKEAMTTVDSEHMHYWKPGELYTSHDKGHKHEIDERRMIALEVNGHTHKLINI